MPDSMVVFYLLEEVPLEQLLSAVPDRCGARFRWAHGVGGYPLAIGRHRPLWRDPRLHAMAPKEAAIDWLQPVACADGHPGRHGFLD